MLKKSLDNKDPETKRGKTLNIRRILRRDMFFALVSFLEKYDLPGAWRVRNWFEAQRYNHSSNDLVICTTEHHFKMILKPFDDNGVEKSIFQTGTYERGTLAVIQSILKTGDRFVDVGANVGLMTIVAAKEVGPAGRVDAFEPVSEIRELLLQSIMMNNIQNIHVHDYALGSVPAKMKIYKHPEVNRGSASIAWVNANVMGTEIRIDTLDHTLSRMSEKAVSMIKIDVEGWELEVLKGGTDTLKKDPQPVVCIEFSRTHPLHGGTHEEMFRLMQSSGYAGYILEKSKAAKSRLKQIDILSLPDHDNVFFVPLSRINTLDAELF
ncbi:FkbM family methyltransferase [Allochromatium vinosum]|uniref:FkbM family methyltransferase n=1 Tax=Allochromatium vinosum TaxID=1049 RepID=UPI0019087400|nr:FkbM family methyltransferase [Allochromatium vinosum]MBK1656444.1 hypothetical protein [Allochromatium vinosum]